MSNPSIRPLESEDHAWLSDFLREHWGAPMIVTCGQIHYASDLQGFRAFSQQNQLQGVITYSITGRECEIVSLDSLKEGIGVGTSLLRAVETVATEHGCRRVWLITSNDNTRALRFYQKRGYRLVAIHRNAIDESRLLKPEIALVGNDGIEIHDEIELELMLV